MKKNLCKSILLVVSVLMLSSLSAQNDRATFGLKGEVTKLSPDYNHSIYVVGRNEWVEYPLEFSQTGTLLSVNDKKVTDKDFDAYYGFKRDAQNRISKISFVAGEGVRWVIFRYDNKGRVVSEEYEYENLDTGEFYPEGNVKFTYDNNDNVIKAVSFDSYDSTTQTVQYTYKSFDDVGNWTARIANCPNLGLNNHLETRMLTYNKKNDGSENIVVDNTSADSTNIIQRNEQVSQNSRKLTFWEVFFSVLLGAALLFMIGYMIYILLIRDRKLVPKTIEDFKTQRQLLGMPDESSDIENESLSPLFNDVYRNLTTVHDAQGEEVNYFTTKEQVEGLRSALVQTLEIAPTHPECVKLYNETLSEYKMMTARQFMGSKTYLIIGGILTVLMSIGGGLQAIPFMLLNILGYYFASKETQFMINAKNIKGTSSNGRSKVMTALMMMGIGVLFSGQTYKTVTKWSDGTTSTDYDNSEHLIALIIGLIIIAVLSFFMFVVAMVNFVRNYLIYK